jgi:hypothetical protein|tara:strand:+ start:509 stop:1135 length:627 start_codon:yes stop_codon:yes gene_type:complete
MVDILPSDNEKRPCYIEFELDAVEDRDASIEQGMPVYKDVEIAHLTPIGCQGTNVVQKFITAKQLDEWRFGDNRRQGPVPYYIEAYEAWKAGLAIPANGLDIKNWPGVTPAQLKTCQEAGVRTVEDLGEANADTIRRLGMGSLLLVQKAKIYLENAETNKAAEEISALRMQMADLKTLLDTQKDQISELQEDLESRPAKRGRPRKEAA